MIEYHNKITACVLLLLAAFINFGCDSNPAAPQVPREVLEAAPEIVTVGNHSYRLSTYLWRDFMPGLLPGGGGSGLLAGVDLIEVDSLPIPKSVRLKHVWVINGEQVWDAPLESAGEPVPYLFKRHAIARGGPKWGPGIRVDVIVGFNVASDALHLVKAPDQWISRTD